ncbi:prenyltransferase [Flavobacterium sp. MK4S-17]|uniref:prenyltransferase n=1 Tax=Flavobacterium sp. MK4S-17 TaxID=2543737 RepID=UPI0013578840|nr:prenyltransferase [Flavobacterium sp. MK4S-17]
MKLLKLISYNNLILIAFALIVLRFGFLDLQPGLPLALNTWQYLLMVLATLLVAAGGFFINNVLASNEHGYSEGKIYNIYSLFTLAGVGLGYYLGTIVNKPIIVAVYVIAAAIIYLYATSLKQVLLISNLIIATAIAMVIIVIGIYNLYPVIMPDNKIYLATIFDLMLDYTLFIFIISIILTLVYNLRNTDADYNSGNTTLPIVAGKERTAKIAFFLTLLPLGLLFYYADKYITNLIWALGYGLLCIAGPLIYFMIKIWGAKTSKDFTHLIIILKLVLLFTVLSAMVVTLNINMHA